MSQRSGCAGLRLGIAALIAIVSVITYYRSTSVNPVTGEKQHVDLSVSQEIALGLQAAPEMLNQYGGPDPDPQVRQLVEQVGQEIVSESAAGQTEYRFKFHALADRRTVNAFALPGGQIFVTRALLERMRTRGQLAGVLAHEVAHVVGRHGAEHIAKQRLTQGLTGAAVVAAYDPYDRNSQYKAAMAAIVGQLVNLRHTREDELEADRLGLRLMVSAGYDPRSMIQVMQILEEAGGRSNRPEFLQTHPNPGNRIERIRETLREQFPEGVPGGLKP